MMNAELKKIEWISPSLLRPYPFNSRTHSDDQVAQIVESIREFGWTNPLLIDEENGLIAGHGRLMAAHRLNAEVVPCLRIHDLSYDQKRAYILADNKLAENAEWDASLLRIELKDLVDVGFDVGLIGFSQDEIDNILKGMEGDGEGEGEKQEFTLMIYSKDEAEVEALRRIFQVKTGSNKVNAGDVLAMIP